MDAFVTAATTQITDLVDKIGPLGVAIIGISAITLAIVLVKGLLKRGA